MVDQNVLPKAELFECVEYRSASEHFEMARGPCAREAPSQVSDQEHCGMRGLARSRMAAEWRVRRVADFRRDRRSLSL